MNLVDVDSRELISAWKVTVVSTPPAVSVRKYDVDTSSGKPTSKKILFRNQWNLRRTFRLLSGNPSILEVK